MFVVILWMFMLFVCWNHRLYRMYANITWKTLYYNIQPIEWREYLINEKVKNVRGWIS